MRAMRPSPPHFDQRIRLCCTTGRGFLPGQGVASSRVDAGPRRAAGPALCRRRTDRRWPAQGLGNAALSVIPQTSTIASHLPRAVGLAVALHRATKLGVSTPWPEDAVVVCSFGDASANHSTATGAINTALNTAYQRLPVPILFVCEDNGLGISVRTPAGWVESAYGSRPGLTYFSADGFDVAATYDAALSRRDQRSPGATASLPTPEDGALPGARRQ